jgi:hypothetical protein
LRRLNLAPPLEWCRPSPSQATPTGAALGRSRVRRGAEGKRAPLTRRDGYIGLHQASVVPHRRGTPGARRREPFLPSPRSAGRTTIGPQSRPATGRHAKRLREHWGTKARILTRGGPHGPLHGCSARGPHPLPGSRLRLYHSTESSTTPRSPQRGLRVCEAVTMVGALPDRAPVPAVRHTVSLEPIHGLQLAPNSSRGYVHSRSRATLEADHPSQPSEGADYALLRVGLESRPDDVTSFSPPSQLHPPDRAARRSA